MINKFFQKRWPFFKTWFVLAVLLVPVKATEFIVVGLHTGYFLWTGLLYGLVVDLAWLSSVLLAFLLPGLLFPPLQKLLAGLFKATALFLFTLYLVDMVVFLVTSAPLDYSVFVHDKELWFIVSHSISHPVLWVALFFAGVVLLFVLAFACGRKTGQRISCNNGCRKSLGLVILLLPLVLVLVPPKQTRFNSDLEYLMVKNKLAYLAKSVMDYQKGYGNSLVHFHPNDIKAFHHELGFKDFVNPDYPFLHVDHDPDVLGGFFRQDTLRPNVVYILCESLSAAFFGENSRFGNFVPFLDSLSKKSLYWPNCLSTTERTLGVLPAVLGSLPHAKKGFNALAGAYPNHLTIMSILKRNGYHTAWFHGGPLGFDDMYDFIKAQHPDFIFNANGKQIANDAKNKAVSWGLYDNVLFQRSLKIITGDTDRSRFDVFLTLTTHAPYNIPNRPYWERKFDSIAARLPEKQKTEALRQRYRLSAFLYLDHSLKQLVNGYEKVAGRRNTIFVITGDHRMGTLPRNGIEKYHVPLIIYSRLLKTGKTFPAVATHYAITPSFVAYLKKNYHIKSPDTVAWVTTSLDTAGYFRNIYSYPFMRNSLVVEEYLHHDYYLFRQKLFKIKPGFDLQQVKNKKMLKAMQARMKRFMKYNIYACFNNRLFPYEYLPDKSHQKLLETHGWKKADTILPNSEYVTILPKYIFHPANEKKIVLDIGFDLYFEKAVADSLPFVVISFRQKNGKYIHYWAYRPVLADGSFPKPFKTNKIHMEKGVDFARDEVRDGAELQIYFWNNKKQSCRIENLSARLTGYFSDSTSLSAAPGQEE